MSSDPEKYLTDEERINANQLLFSAASQLREVANQLHEVAELYSQPIRLSCIGIDTPVVNDPIITRITNNNSPSNSQLQLHSYSTVQAFDPDEKQMMLDIYQGTVVDLQGNTVANGIPYGLLSGGLNGDYFWDTFVNNRMYGTKSGQNTLSYLDVTDPSLSETVVFDAGAPLSIGGQSNGSTNSGNGQGNPTDDGTLVILTSPTTLYLYDITTNSVVRSQALPANVDWAGISHLGGYYVVVSNSPNTTRVYRTSDGQLLHQNGDVNHADFTVDLATGEEYLHYVGNPQKKLHLESGVFTNTGSVLAYGHMSGRSENGYVTFSCDGACGHGVDVVGRMPVMGFWDNDIEIFSPMPNHIYVPPSNGGTSAAVTALQCTTSRSGKYTLVSIADPINAADTYMITWF